MKKPVKIALISLASLAGLFLLVSLGFFFKFKKAVGLMTPADTFAINDSVFCIKDNYVNAFIFKCDDGYIMFDAGMREKNVLEQMRTFNIEPGEVIALILTHTDGDHTGATGALTNASVRLHREEEQMINGTTAKMGFKHDWNFGEYQLFDSGEILSIGGLSIEVFHTPGHTPGSCCFSVNGAYLVSGDNLLMEDDKYAPFVEQFTMDPPLNAESIKNIPDPTLYKYVLTGHSGVWKNELF